MHILIAQYDEGDLVEAEDLFCFHRVDISPSVTGIRLRRSLAVGTVSDQYFMGSPPSEEEHLPSCEFFGLIVQHFRSCEDFLVLLASM